MARAAVGLFENSQSVDGIIHDLEISGFPRNNIRVLNEPADMAGRGMMSIPHTDFEVDLVRELRRSGPPKRMRKLTSKVSEMEESSFSPPVRTSRWTRPLKL